MGGKRDKQHAQESTALARVYPRWRKNYQRMSKAIGRDSTVVIASRELLGKAGSAAEWETAWMTQERLKCSLSLPWQRVLLHLNVYQHSLGRGRHTPLGEEQALQC